MSKDVVRGARVVIIRRETPEAPEATFDGLCLNFTMDQTLIGTHGEPAVEAIIADMDRLKHGGTADWQHALLRLGDIRHISHSDWLEGRSMWAYMMADETTPLTTLSPDTVQEIAARAAHEVNRIVCALHGDFSQPTWADAPEWQKSSAVLGVKLIGANPLTTPEQSHESWMAQKVADGWKYGPYKDVEKKEHPAMVPYSLLPDAQRVKDFFFGAVVRAVLDVQQLPVTLDDEGEFSRDKPPAGRPLTDAEVAHSESLPLPESAPEPKATDAPAQEKEPEAQTAGIAEMPKGGVNLTALEVAAYVDHPDSTYIVGNMTVYVKDGAFHFNGFKFAVKEDADAYALSQNAPAPTVTEPQADQATQQDAPTDADAGAGADASQAGVTEPPAGEVARKTSAQRKAEKAAAKQAADAGTAPTGEATAS